MKRQSEAPNVTIRALSGADGYRLELRGAGDLEPLPLPIHDPTVLRHVHARFGNALERAKNAWQRPGTLPLQQAGAALADLAKAGSLLLSRVLVRAQESLTELDAAMIRWCPSLHQAPGRIPVLHVEPGVAQFLPWEVIPLFGLFRDGWVETVDGLEQAAGSFPGFSAVVERALVNKTSAQSPWLSTQNDQLTLRFLWHAKYPGASGELAFFRNRDVIRLEGPCPSPGDPLPGPDTIARYMADPGLGLDGRRVEHPHQIMHFSCHCDARAANGPTDDGEFALHLATEDGDSVRIPVEEILGKLILEWKDARRRTLEKPLVFLNACATGVYDPSTLTSVVEPFHKNENRGVIATAANLPDRHAHAFSRRFYFELLNGRTVGEALYEAKWDLLRSRKNPMGLLYSLYGMSALQVAPLPSRTYADASPAHT
ncbi:CHAT domain-containing protein [Streptomyces sp. F001]|uniref:CHAT domain-containing protein n=1 Tax=Streptomyces sp. F001 TaxID=1510026 RepID=UPI00101E5B42|nr:CHAT domain-containing protein [Streptomyces sp. F001]RZB13669.1 CHAT domain-containing protein [Streptomyces sp. F001]